MCTLTYRCNPCVFVSRITLVWLFAFSVSLMADPCWGQPQQPSGTTVAPAAKPAATEPAATKPAAGPVKYDELPCNESRKNDRKTLPKLLKNATPSAADLTTLQTYLEEYGLARWTVKAHEHEVRSFRQELRTNFRRIRSPQAYDQVNDLALRILGDMANGNYSPVARINAMLAIGDLNVREPARSTEKPAPLARALPVMLQAYGDPGQIDGVRLAALLGIFRHVSLEIADAQVRNSQVLPVMLELAKANQPPDERSAEGHAWFRVRAIETLGALAVTGQQGAVANTLGEVAGDEESPLWVRCTAARSLGQLDYADPSGMDSGELIAKLTELATAICNQEVAVLDKLKRDELIAGHKVQGPSAGSGMYSAMATGGSGGMYEGAEMGMGMEEEQDPMSEMEDMYRGAMGGSGGIAAKKVEEEDTMETRRIKGSRRRLKDRLLSVLMGLGTDVKRDDGDRAGIHVLTTDPDQETLLNDLTAAITTLLDALNDKEALDSDTLDEAIATASDEIGQVLAGTSSGTEEQPPTETTAAAAPVAP